MNHPGRTPQNLGIFQNYMARGEEQLVVQEHAMSLTGDSFSVKDGRNSDMLKVQGKAMTMSARKRVTDPRGTWLFDIRKSRIPLSRSFYGQDPENNVLFKVTCHLSRKSLP